MQVGSALQEEEETPLVPPNPPCDPFDMTHEQLASFVGELWGFLRLLVQENLVLKAKLQTLADAASADMAKKVEGQLGNMLGGLMGMLGEAAVEGLSEAAEEMEEGI